MEKTCTPAAAADPDKWGTPDTIFEALGFSRDDCFDPCPLDWHPNTHPNGLAVDWYAQPKRVIFVNPPFSSRNVWMNRAAELHDLHLNSPLGQKELWLLLPLDTLAQKWFDPIYERASKIVVLQGSQRFLRPGETTPTGHSRPYTMLVMLGETVGDCEFRVHRKF